MSKPLRVGIAGYGVVGQRRHHFIDQNPYLKTVAVCDRVFTDADLADDTLRKHRSYQDLLNEDLNVLFVCMTNDIAPDVTIAALERDIHVFCEKPPGRSVADVLRVRETESRRRGIKLKYGFNHRYHDSVRDALAIVKSGDLGPVLNMRGVYGKSRFISFGKHSDWRTKREIAGGGILLDQGIHMVDLMRLFGGNFDSVYSYVSNDFWGHDVEDNAYALMRSDQGVVAMLHSSATQWKHMFQLDITLAKGAITLSGILSGSKSYGEETMIVAYADENDQGDPKEVTTRYENDPSWSDEINEFADVILSDGQVIKGSSLDALETMRLVERIYNADPDWRLKIQ